ncbi:MAG: 4Fe-4S binding protein, partial [Candidatus Rokuibacteriota bacterium]
VFDDAQRQELSCDTVLIAAGQAPDLSFLNDGGTDVEQIRPGWPKVDPESLATTAAGVFVAGDMAHGTRLVIDAVASGKKAARSIYAFVAGRRLVPEALSAHFPLERYEREPGYEAVRRVEVPAADPGERLAAADRPVETGFAESQARREASRCLDCGVTPVFDGARCVLCGGCADVCPTLCLKLVPLSALEPGTGMDAAIDRTFGAGADREANSAILKDEDRCIRCALCAQRCPTEAIVMDRVWFRVDWRPV